MNTKQKLEVMKEIDEANRQHVEGWKREMVLSTHVAKGFENPEMHNYYFTFGSDPLYPYGQDDYVLIRCASAEMACRMFDIRFPKRPGSECMNCAFMYTEEKWKTGVRQYYLDAEGIEQEPAESIILTVGSR